MKTLQRRYDIDWIRVIAIGLLIIYHIAIAFQPWGVYIAFIQHNESLEFLWTPMSMLNVWRIPLLFFVSGMGVYFAIKKRNWKQLLIERSQRILIPFVFGFFAIVPLHVFIFQKYYDMKLDFTPSPGHLWFLGNIFCYVVLLSPIFFYLKHNEHGTIHNALKKLLAKPWGLLLTTIPFLLEVHFVQPNTFEFYAMNWHGFFLGLLAFLFGFVFTYSGETFWNNILNWRWMYFASAAILFAVRLWIFELKVPLYLTAIESNLWVWTVFGFGYKYLNKPSKILTYLSQSAYPVYILHMFVLYGFSYLLFPLGIGALSKFVLLVVFTTAGCLLLFELVIKRVFWIRPLFGLKLHRTKVKATKPTEYQIYS